MMATAQLEKKHAVIDIIRAKMIELHARMNFPWAGKELSCDGKRHCYRMDTYFRTLDGKMLAASRPSGVMPVSTLNAVFTAALNREQLR